MIPMIDLISQYASLRDEIDAAVADVLRRGRFIGGEACRGFEQEFAAYCGVRSACGVANGTDALYLALHGMGIGVGDEVITTPFSFVSTATAITRTGAKLVFADIEDRLLTLDTSAVAERITSRTKAIVAVHLYGHTADMDALGTLAERHHLALVEDAAQAHGARWHGERAGSLGTAACFSFYPTKNLSAAGDAGMVTSDDQELLERVRRLANHGEDVEGSRGAKYEHLELGINSRLDTLQAAILRVKLAHLDRWNERRRQLARVYREALGDIPELRLPRDDARCEPVYHQFTVRTPERDALRAHLTEHGITSAIHYPRPIYRQPAYEALRIPEGAHPVAEKAAREVLSLPLYPELSDENVQRIAREVASFFEKERS